MFPHPTPAQALRLALAALLGALAGDAPQLARAADVAVSMRDVRQSLFATCFGTERDGWMVGELGRIFRTRDGGATWVRQDADTKRPFLAAACIDADTAWIAGKEGIVYATSDGGATWTKGDTGSNRHLFTLQFPTRERGHGAGDFGTMIHTEDAGATWAKLQVPPDVELPMSALDTGVEPGDVNLYAMSYSDPDHLWVVGEFGTIMASTDGGRTFRQQKSPIESSLFGVHFPDAQHGWAVGIDAMIIRTEDGGTTWRIQPPPIQQRSFYDVVVRGPRGWIVGDAGTILRSTDGGGTWAVEPLPIQLAANWIRSVWLTPAGQGIAVGAEGLVFRLDGARVERLARVQRGRLS